VLLPLASAILFAMLAWSGAVMAIGALASTGIADRALVSAWYAIVPFHYFVDSRIWRRRRAVG